MRPQDIGKDLHVMYCTIRTIPEYSISMIDGWEVRGGGVDDSVKLRITRY